MVKTLTDKDIPEPWFGKKNKLASTPKVTRAESKQMAEQHMVEDDNLGENSNKEKGRGKGKVNEFGTGRGKTKVKSVRTATAGVVFGRSKQSIPDPEELRRKRIADAVACGRVVRTILNSPTRRTCPTTLEGESSPENIQAELESGDIEMDSHSPSPLEQNPTACAGIVNELLFVML
jgi:hypothetical protein